MFLRRRRNIMLRCLFGVLWRMLLRSHMCVFHSPSHLNCCATRCSLCHMTWCCCILRWYYQATDIFHSSRNHTNAKAGTGWRGKISRISRAGVSSAMWFFGRCMGCWKWRKDWRIWDRRSDSPYSLFTPPLFSDLHVARFMLDCLAVHPWWWDVIFTFLAAIFTPIWWLGSVSGFGWVAAWCAAISYGRAISNVQILNEEYFSISFFLTWYFSRRWMLYCYCQCRYPTLGLLYLLKCVCARFSPHVSFKRAPGSIVCTCT